MPARRKHDVPVFLSSSARALARSLGARPDRLKSHLGIVGHRTRPEGGERPQPRRSDRGRGGNRGRNDRNRGGKGGYNDRNRRPRGDRSRPNPAPRAEGPKTDDPNTPIYGRIEKK